MNEFYESSGNEVKRQITGSMFPEKLVFDGRLYRTTRVNEAVRLIWAMGAVFSGNKKGQTDQKIDLSSLVTPSPEISNHFIDDLKRLACLIHHSETT